ncbi:hypothetical protein T10_8776 [Trichinella papuae]|uniref:Uncharacterized protein n=1 Tax=Trichinella papuae TaxID=268474 RepID=A0A0V1MPA7_9BILA|nr:hypothetical protein T10_8776 [Trichinella papuae]
MCGRVSRSYPHRRQFWYERLEDLARQGSKSRRAGNAKRNAAKLVYLPVVMKREEDRSSTTQLAVFPWRLHWSQASRWRVWIAPPKTLITLFFLKGLRTETV